MVNLAGELVLGRNQLLQICQPLVKEVAGLNGVLQHISRITTEMQEKIMQLRMQPVAIIFSKFTRVVRDLSHKLNKEVKLEIYGEDVELDKTIIEGLSDPLTHLIRNSVDHGIELPEERVANGKSANGTIKLQAYHQGGMVHIEVIDDGKGVDPAIVGKKAIEKGLITKDNLEVMTEKDIVKLIFKPGFSTATTVSDVSGRGVGMDVVMTNIDQLGGTVDVESKKGEGTKVSIVLPLTLAIVSGLIVEVKKQRFIIPEINVEELVRIIPEEKKELVNNVQETYVLHLRETLLPLLNLSEALGMENSDDLLQQIANPDKSFEVIVIRHGEGVFCIVVDDIVKIEEIVVKPLPHYLKRMKTFSGATILGDGTVALILDIVGIAEKMSVDKFELTDKDEDEKTRSKDK